jgi:hypothetical protein
MRKKPTIGDIIEIPTSNGLCYAHYTHEHRTYGSLIRVFPRFYEVRPVDVQLLVCGDPKFLCFVPIDKSIRHGDFVIVGNAELKSDAKIFPTFRAGMKSPATDKVENWWFWDGNNEWKVGNITEDQRKMPLRQVWNDTMLLHRIVSGWTPQNDLL